MNKPKNFFFAAVITMIMVFVLGNWVTSAQATGVSILGATPTPTGHARGAARYPAGRDPFC
ncbi:hypothetical protein ANAEL_04640 [Anaerolineales bacterium]|nr:hypothetical protein ANAEL_04640 [Anaerolineales bacterium]